MTKLEALLAAVLVGSAPVATVAVAQPDDAGQGRPHRRWTALSEPIAASGDRQLIRLNDQPAIAIRLQLERGIVYIQQIAVEMENGRTQVKQVGRWMSADQDAIETVELGGPSPVRRVIVYTGRGRGEYRILGA
jgi:hypothetical protein